MVTGLGLRQQGRMAGHPDSIQGAGEIELSSSGSPWPRCSFLMPLGPYPYLYHVNLCLRSSFNLYPQSGHQVPDLFLTLDFYPSPLVLNYGALSHSNSLYFHQPAARALLPPSRLSQCQYPACSLQDLCP